MLSKRLGEMLGCGVIQFLRNLRDAQAFVCQIDFLAADIRASCFLLLKGLAVIFFSGTVPSGGHLTQEFFGQVFPE